MVVVGDVYGEVIVLVPVAELGVVAIGVELLSSSFSITLLPE